MQKFSASREAKEFLISKIVSESQYENIPLSEIERKILYFSETAWTLPDMEEVSYAFDRDYDLEEYEKKIGAPSAAPRSERLAHTTLTPGKKLSAPSVRKITIY